MALIWPLHPSLFCSTPFWNTSKMVAVTWWKYASTKGQLTVLASPQVLCIWRAVTFVITYFIHNLQNISDNWFRLFLTFERNKVILWPSPSASTENVWTAIEYACESEDGTQLWDVGFYLPYQTAVHLFAFLGLDLPQVELQLLALQHVAVCPATLARSGGNASCKRKWKMQSFITVNVENINIVSVGIEILKEFWPGVV